MMDVTSSIYMRSSLRYLLPILFLVTCVAGLSRRTHQYIASASAPSMTGTPRPILPETQPAVIIESEAASPTPTQPPPTQTATPESPPVYVFGPTGFPPGFNPLTGLPVSDPEWLERRPIAIKITNFPRSARPQWGLNLADHVIEYYIGDDMTRFIGIFYGMQAHRVGPVRSARLFDEHVMRMYKSFLVFGYADPKVRAELFDQDLIPYLIFETPNNCPPICRIVNGLAYNNLFADTEGLGRYFKKKQKNDGRQNLDGLRFDIQPPAGGQSGEHLSIYYTLVAYNRWEYAPQQSRYLRFQEVENDHGQTLLYKPLLDMANEQQIVADNVVVLFTSHDTFYKSNSTWIIDIPLKHKGEGFAYRDGSVYPIVWSRNAEDQMITLYFTNGDLYPLKPGNTWFEVIGATSQFNVGEDGTWNFNFHIP
jgi:hypothetical protein